MGAESKHFDYGRLLKDAKAGLRLPDTALKAIRQQLESGQFEDDPYTLLHILGRAADKDSQSIVKKYTKYGLRDPLDDGLVRRIALQVLGHMWELPEAFDIAAKLVFDDPSPFVRAVAATVIGRLGSTYSKLRQGAAALLLKGLEQRNNVEQTVWESFYEGILHLMGVPVQEWPSSTHALKDSEVRWDVVAKARELLPRE